MNDLLNDIKTDDGLLRHAAKIRQFLLAYAMYDAADEKFQQDCDARCWGDADKSSDLVYFARERRNNAWAELNGAVSVKETR